MEVSTLDWLDPTKFFSVSSFLWASIDVYCDRQAAGCFWLPRRFLLHKMFKYLNKHKEVCVLMCPGLYRDMKKLATGNKL